MDITPAIPKNKNSIKSYGPDGFKVNENFYRNSLIIMPNQVLEVKISNIEDLLLQNWQNIFDVCPEIVLIGTGLNHKIIDKKIKDKIKQNLNLVIAIDEMNTASACRTYNILMMEDRNVAAFLMEIL